jgi:hypothetical protein
MATNKSWKPPLGLTDNSNKGKGIEASPSTVTSPIDNRNMEFLPTGEDGVEELTYSFNPTNMQYDKQARRTPTGFDSDKENHQQNSQNINVPLNEFKEVTGRKRIRQPFKPAPN